MPTTFPIEGGPGTFRPALTVEDLRNPKRKSGFDFVAYGPDGSKTRPFFGQVQPPRVVPAYHGPRRATAIEAAQDVVDYLNGHAANAAPRLLGPVKTTTDLDLALKQEVVHFPGPKRDVVPSDLTDKPDWVYWILLPTGRVKLGRSHRPRENRLSSYQTLFEEELKIVAVVKCPTRKDGEALERRLQTALAPFKVEGFGTELFTQDILPKFEIADLVDGEIVPRD